MPDPWQPILPLTMESIVLYLACHDWIKVDEYTGVIAYVDSLVRKNGQRPKLWALIDFNHGDQSIPEILKETLNGAASLRIELEFDCQIEQEKPLSMTFHSGQMATGDIMRYVSSDELKKFKPINRIQFRGAIKDFACK